MTAPAPDFTQLTALLRQLTIQSAAEELARARAGQPINEKGLKGQIIDLSTISESAPFAGNTDAFGFHILKRSSHPGTQLILQTGGKSAAFGPGDWIRGRLERGWILQPGPLCPSAGTCELQIITNPTATFKEWEGQGGEIQRQVLLGTITNSGALTFVSVTENTDPTTLAAADGVWDGSGFNEIELWVDGWVDAGNKLTTVDLYPWSVPKGVTATFWAQQPDQMKSLVDTVPTALRYRMVSWKLNSAADLGYFSIRNLLPAGATQLGFLVIGVK